MLPPAQIGAMIMMLGVALDCGGGHEATPNPGGATVTENADYRWQSIKLPNGNIVLGYFPDVMSTVFFKDDGIDAMVEYLKSQK